MGVSPFSLLISRSTLLRFRIHRRSSIYTLFYVPLANEFLLQSNVLRRHYWPPRDYRARLLDLVLYHQHPVIVKISEQY